jgi:hypothetical protein
MKKRTRIQLAANREAMQNLWAERCEAHDLAPIMLITKDVATGKTVTLCHGSATVQDLTTAAEEARLEILLAVLNEQQRREQQQASTSTPTPTREPACDDDTSSDPREPPSVGDWFTDANGSP